MLCALAMVDAASRPASQDICPDHSEISSFQRPLAQVLANAPLLHTRAACKGKTQDCSRALSPQVSRVAVACFPLLEARVVTWLGGPPGSGKSSLALRAVQYGFLSAECEPDPSGYDWLASFGDTRRKRRDHALANASSWLLHAATSGTMIGSCYGEWLLSSPAHVLRVLLLPEAGVYAARHKQRGSTGWSSDGWRAASQSYNSSLRVWQQHGDSIVRVEDRLHVPQCAPLGELASHRAPRTPMHSHE